MHNGDQTMNKGKMSPIESGVKQFSVRCLYQWWVSWIALCSSLVEQAVTCSSLLLITGPFVGPDSKCSVATDFMDDLLINIIVMKFCTCC